MYSRFPVDQVQQDLDREPRFLPKLSRVGVRNRITFLFIGLGLFAVGAIYDSVIHRYSQYRRAQIQDETWKATQLRNAMDNRPVSQKH